MTKKATLNFKGVAFLLIVIFVWLLTLFVNAEG